MNGVVPVAVNAMPFQAHGGHLRVGDGDPGRVFAAVEFRVPLARAWREVTDGDGEARASRQLLQFPLPQAEADKP